MASSLLVPVVLVLAVSQVLQSTSVSDEKRLIKHLLDNYAKVGLYGRPVYNSSHAVRVSFGLALIQLAPEKEDRHEATLIFSTWHRHMWKDPMLQWSPEDFGGVDHIRVPVSKIWKPDIMNFHGFPGEDIGSGDEALAVVSVDGTVLWIPPWQTKIRCPKDKDTYTCEMKFGSWTYSQEQIDLQVYDGAERVDLADYVTSNRYRIVGSSVKRNSAKYACCTENYVSLDFTLKLKDV